MYNHTVDHKDLKPAPSSPPLSQQSYCILQQSKPIVQNLNFPQKTTEYLLRGSERLPRRDMLFILYPPHGVRARAEGLQAGLRAVGEGPVPGEGCGRDGGPGCQPRYSSFHSQLPALLDSSAQGSGIPLQFGFTSRTNRARC